MVSIRKVPVVAALLAAAFSVGLGAIGNNVFAHSAVTIDRYLVGAPVPEPRTCALMLAGLGLVFAAAVRRRRAAGGSMTSAML